MINKILYILDNNRCQYGLFIIPGNHDKINEKSTENALMFLRNEATLISSPQYIHELKFWLIPYQSDKNQLITILSNIPEGSRDHYAPKGVLTANMGHYVQDTSSLPTKAFREILE